MCGRFGLQKRLGLGRGHLRLWALKFAYRVVVWLSLFQYCEPLRSGPCHEMRAAKECRLNLSFGGDWLGFAQR